ncbi:MAG TPA: NADPH:quinone reductase [Jatrophihabitans sp.]|nr:NADPH:quinone reductase [Jatrophihabitans sp.]
MTTVDDPAPVVGLPERGDFAGRIGLIEPAGLRTAGYARAAYIESVGPAEAIRIGEVAVPPLGQSDVLVDVEVTTVNPVDTFVRSGLFAVPGPFPLVVSRDLVGTVREVGCGASGFAPGDRVWCNSLGHGGRQGAAAERVAVAADRLYPMPAGVGAVDTVAVLHPAATAYLALFTHGRLRAGDTVLVSGAAGNVGSALVLLAAWAGATVLATARPADAEHCRSLGAVEVFDYTDPNLAGRVRAASPRGVDLVLDTSGVNDLTTSVEVLARRGRIVLLAGARTRPVLPAGALYMKDGAIVGFVISHAGVSELAEAAGLINQLLAGGQLRARTVEERPLAAMPSVHRELEDGRLRGVRTVLHV